MKLKLPSIGQTWKLQRFIDKISGSYLNFDSNPTFLLFNTQGATSVHVPLNVAYNNMLNYNWRRIK